jgi:hypothetical protein
MSKRSKPERVGYSKDSKRREIKAPTRGRKKGSK